MAEIIPQPIPPRCGAVGALVVGGRVVGQLRCELDAGHDDPDLLAFDIYGIGSEKHRAVLEWAPEGEPDLDLFDPAERFDVEIPAE